MLGTKCVLFVYKYHVIQKVYEKFANTNKCSLNYSRALESYLPKDCTISPYSSMAKWDIDFDSVMHDIIIKSTQ